jgi:hypothetical protein
MDAGVILILGSILCLFISVVLGAIDMKKQSNKLKFFSDLLFWIGIILLLILLGSRSPFP